LKKWHCNMIASLHEDNSKISSQFVCTFTWQGLRSMQ
jgi:hypothetical protein